MSPLLAPLAALFVAPRNGPQPPFSPAVSDPTTAPTEPLITWQPPAAAESRPSAPGAAGVPDAGTAEPRWPVAAGSEPVAGMARDADRGPAHAAVLGTGSGALALAAAVAGELRARHRARAALLFVWETSAESSLAVPAWPHAREVAASLAPDHSVTARGRVVHVHLPDDAAAAAEVATRLIRDARLPTVLMLGSPRVAAFDGLLAGRDLLVVAEAPGPAGPVAALAVGELRGINARVVVAPPIAGAGRRLVALCGLGRARFLAERPDAGAA